MCYTGGMKALLLALLPLLTHLPSSALPSSHPFVMRASSAADDLAQALEEEKAGEGSIDRATWTRLVFVWAYHESAFYTDAVGDGGASVGVMQVQTPEKWLAGATREKVLKDRVLGFRVGIRVMRELVKKCGSLRAGLTAYATDGSCKTWTLPLVTRRMKIAGVE